MPQQRARATVVSVVFALLSLVATAARADQIDDYVRAKMKEHSLPGVSLAIVQEGKVTKIGSYGMADVARGTPVVPETVFMIGSVSKQFIATGIMLLVQDGQLKVDDPISRYLEGTPPAWQPITIRHLLTHTSGIVRESPAFDFAKAQPDADVIKAAYPLPLRFTPGEKWEYCNVGYFALAEIISKVSGKPWTQFLQERVFKPAGMTMTAPTNVTPMLPNRAIGYVDKDNSRATNDFVALRPSGAFLSTVGDLAKWDALLYTNKPLSEASRRAMWTQAQLNDGSKADYGFGWIVATRKTGQHVVSHGGSLPGFRANFARFVDERATVIVLINGDDADAHGLASGVAQIYLADRQQLAVPTPARGQGRGR